METDQIIHGDCIKILADLPEKSVEMVFADPPYNLQLQNELWRPNQTHVEAVKDSWDKFNSFEEYDNFCLQWLSGCRRVLKDTGTIWVIGTYHNIFRIGSIIQNLGFWILNDIVYIKTNPMPNFHGVRFTNAHETLVWAQKKKGARYTFNHHTAKALNDDLQMRSDWTIRAAIGKERIKKENGKKAHSTQKPEALLYRILLSSTEPGDTVLDPFFGSGTTGAVAKKLGRHYIGIERDYEYVRIARERIASVPSSPKTVLEIPEPRKRERIPFGSILEMGLLKPGQTLYFIRDGIAATILANGHVRCGNMTGSIHGVARSLLNDAPANGWECWFFEDENGERNLINQLREEIRNCSDQGDSC
jgi:site-specific DNA-methyltransferase (adenine-specific)